MGDMGRRHAYNLRRLVPQARLLAVADIDVERAQRLAAELEIEYVFGNTNELLDCKDIDAVVIASPDKFHAEGIQLSAAAGKDIFCEKPISTNLADAYAASEMVKKFGVRLQIGFMRRYDVAHREAMRRIETGEIGKPVIFKSLGRDKDEPPISCYQSGVNGMLFYNSTIHDFDLARWLMQDEVTGVHAYTTVAIRPEVAEYNDVVASVVNLRFHGGAIGNVESFVQALYGYDVRTEVIGSKGSILIGSLQKTPVTFLSTNGSTEILADHYLSRFADAYVAEMNDFVHNVLHDCPLRVSGEDGVRALAIAVAAEQSHLQDRPCAVALDQTEVAGGVSR